jgi:hypothetical protein
VSILHIVEVRSAGDDMGASMILMRTWLDHRRFEPDSFCQLNDDLGICCRLEFKVESEAVAFASAFGGRIVERTAKLAS